METLDVYDATAHHLRQAQLNEKVVTRAIIGTIGTIDAYLLPDAKGLKALQQYLVGDTNDARQTIRNQVLATTPDDLRRFADSLAALTDDGRVVVLGSDQALLRANDVRGGDWLKTKSAI